MLAFIRSGLLHVKIRVPGGHAGVGVVSLGGAPLITYPTFVTPEFREFFQVG